MFDGGAVFKVIVGAERSSWFVLLVITLLSMPIAVVWVVTTLMPVVLLLVVAVVPLPAAVAPVVRRRLCRGGCLFSLDTE